MPKQECLAYILGSCNWRQSGFPLDRRSLPHYLWNNGIHKHTFIVSQHLVLASQFLKTHIARVRYHYDDMPNDQKNWKYALQRDPSAKEMVDGVPAFTNQLKHFIAVTRREAGPNCSVEDGVKAVLVADAVFKSLRTGGPALV